MDKKTVFNLKSCMFYIYLIIYSCFLLSLNNVNCINNNNYKNFLDIISNNSNIYLKSKSDPINKYYTLFTSLSLKIKKKARLSVKKNLTTKNKSFLTNNELNSNNYNNLLAYFNHEKEEIILTNTKEVNYKLIAKVNYIKSINNSEGWNKLHIKTYNDKEGVVNSLLQCYTAGYLEGFISFDDISNYFNNIHVFFRDYSKESLDNLYKIYDLVYNSLIKKLESPEFLNDLEKKTQQEKEQWNYYFCILMQLDGLVNGYNSNIEDNNIQNLKKKLSLLDFLLINSEGNYGDIKSVIEMSDIKKYDLADNIDFSSKETLEKVFNTSDINKIWRNMLKHSHCSVIVKLVKDMNGKYDIFAGHDTWSSYAELVRTLKTYDFAFDSEFYKNHENTSDYAIQDPLIINQRKRISFSSYPGVLFSGDDFYVLDSNIVLLQTTLNVLNQYRYQKLIDFENYVPEFMRLMAINYTATSGKNWADLYKSSKNSLYITQWIVVDYKELEKVNNLNNNLDSDFNNLKNIAFLLEEIPRNIFVKDVTKELFKNTYLGSFNLPAFSESLEILGYNKLRFNLDNPDINDRGFILKNINSSIIDSNSFALAISHNRYNTSSVGNFINDPSIRDPSKAMMARYDLTDDTSDNYFGGIDYKFVNSELVKNLEFKAKLGPTYNEDIKPFEFHFKGQDVVNKKYYLGIPKKIKFSEILFGPINIE